MRIGLFRGSLLCVIALAAVGVSQGGPAAQAAASRPARATPPTSVLAPCTKPLYAPNLNCESTSPKVDRWWSSTTATEKCTVRFNVNWDDGHTSTRTFVDEPKGIHLIASHTYNPKIAATYSELVTSTVVSGSCTPAATTTFVITHVLNTLPSWWTDLAIPSACLKDLVPNPIDVGLSEKDLGDTLGLFKIGARYAALFAVLEGPLDALEVYNVLFVMPADCIVKAGVVPDSRDHSVPGVIGPLPRAYTYGVHHPGKLFKPSGQVPQRPQIKAVDGYQKGSLVYFTISFTNPGNDAKGFGFVGIKGAGWAEENHPFSHPSYGIVGHDKVSYPFNLGCGTPEQQHTSYVAAWIYDKANIRSQPVEIALSCTT
jgi:hypothetical protein